MLRGSFSKRPLLLEGTLAAGEGKRQSRMDYTPLIPALHTTHANQMPRAWLLSGREAAAGASFIRSNS